MQLFTTKIQKQENLFVKIKKLLFYVFFTKNTTLKSINPHFNFVKQKVIHSYSQIFCIFPHIKKLDKIKLFCYSQLKRRKFYSHF